MNGYYNKKPPIKDDGKIPFLGASKYNNGITGFTTIDFINRYDKVGNLNQDDVSKRYFTGGCIAITNNGSVGYAYYQESAYTCSHDITPVYLKNGTVMNRHLALFLIPSIERAGLSFHYAKKWRPERMVRSKLLLPVNAEGKPDWEYMEAYMRQVEAELLKKALPFFNDTKE